MRALGGAHLAGWSPATALTLYWCGNLSGATPVAQRIAVHRAVTRKQRHLSTPSAAISLRTPAP